MDFEPITIVVKLILWCCGIAIAVAVWALFLLGAFLGVQWYVSAVAILLIGRFLIGFAEN